MRRVDAVVAGGGLAGIAAALECADAGLDTALLERRPRLGGATYSMPRGTRTIDNGQHVFLRCCTAYRSLLRRIGADHLTELQPRLEIPLVLPGGGVRRLHRSAWPAPLHLLPMLVSLPWLSPAERLRAASAVLALRAVDPGDPKVDERSLGEWLHERGQSARTASAVWELVVRPTLNMRPHDASLAMAAKVFRTGLLDQTAAGDIGWARVPLGAVHGDAAARALSAAGVEVATHTSISSIEPRRDAFSVKTSAGEIEAGRVIACLPPGPAVKVLPRGAVDAGAVGRLGGSPIVNLHVVYDRPVTRLRIAAAARGPVQWIFDRTDASGAAGGQYLAVTLSAADAFVGMPVARLRALFEPALVDLFPAARNARVEDFFVTRDRRATFRAIPGSGRLRPPQRTRIRHLYVAGAWTRTGWPDTMEGAVRSGRGAAAAALADTTSWQRPRAVVG